MDFLVTSSTLNTSFDYADVIIVQGNYVKDAINGELQAVSGVCYHINKDGERADLISGFNGNVRDGKLMYSFTEVMSLEDFEKVKKAIEDIEAKILGENKK